MNQSQSPSIQAAMAFFQKPVWARLLTALVQKYQALGRIGGQITLSHCSAEEKQEIASFLQRRLTSSDKITVRLADFQQALDQSAFACNLVDLWQALYPDHPLLSRPEQREIRQQAHVRFLTDLQTIANDLPADAPGKRWLLTGKHGLEALFTRYKNQAAAEQEKLLETIHMVNVALAHLPAPHGFKRLALFATEITGNPHYFDANAPGGRLLFYALNDLADQTTFSTHEDTHGHNQRHLLYYDVGLLLDTLSSTVAAFQLGDATCINGQHDPFLTAAGGRPLVLPLRQLLSWQAVHPASSHVYILENPQVFETLIDAFELSDNLKHGPRPPTLICTAGWPSTAAIHLLTLLTTTHAQTRLFYNGDFDVQGLRIAAHLLARFPHHCQLWRYTPSDYALTLHSHSPQLNSQEQAELQTLPEPFQSLATAMLALGKKGYQEGISSLLLQDIHGA